MDRSDGNLDVSITASGLAEGDHGWHVHTFGDVSSPVGTAVGGHFVGDCDGCRPADKLQEAGLLNDGIPLVANDAGEINFSYVETEAKATGVNSIIGRSVIIHGDGENSGARVAQCVIGRASEAGTGPSAPVTRPDVELATCRVRSTYNAPNPNIDGIITFTTTVNEDGLKTKARQLEDNWQRSLTARLR